MIILLTGANGLLGQKLVELLAPLSHVELIACSKGRNRNGLQGNYEYAEVDLMIEGAMGSFILEKKPDAIIHTAALTNVDACETQQGECQRLNVDAVSEIVEACKITQSHLVHLSTDFVFDGLNGPYSEEMEPNPLSVYGKSKWLSEQIVQNAGLAKWAIARTIIVYGIGHEMSRSNLVLWAKDALQQGNELKIVNDQFRSPTLAEDLAEGCWSIVEKEATGIFHLGGPEIKSIYELVLDVASVFGGDKSLLISTSSEELGQPANRPKKTGLKIDKARQILNYQPRSFVKGLQHVKQLLENQTFN